MPWAPAELRRLLAQVLAIDERSEKGRPVPVIVELKRAAKRLRELLARLGSVAVPSLPRSCPPLAKWPQLDGKDDVERSVLSHRRRKAATRLDLIVADLIEALAAGNGGGVGEGVNEDEEGEDDAAADGADAGTG